MSLLVAGLHGEDLQQIFYTGQMASKQLLKTLGSNMKKFMQKKDIKGAIEFCSQNAYRLTEEVNQKLGENISIKRISLKFRNPLNKPTKTEAKILFQLENTKSAVLTKVADGTYKFYQPLRINKPVCLKCHGDDKNLNKQAYKIIEQKYPQDKAVDYKLGDLRAIIEIEISQTSMTNKLTKLINKKYLF